MNLCSNPLGLALCSYLLWLRMEPPYTDAIYHRVADVEDIQWGRITVFSSCLSGFLGTSLIGHYMIEDTGLNGPLVWSIRASSWLIQDAWNLEVFPHIQACFKKKNTCKVGQLFKKGKRDAWPERGQMLCMFEDWFISFSHTIFHTCMQMDPGQPDPI